MDELTPSEYIRVRNEQFREEVIASRLAFIRDFCEMLTIACFIFGMLMFFVSFGGWLHG